MYLHDIRIDLQIFPISSSRLGKFNQVSHVPRGSPRIFFLHAQFRTEHNKPVYMRSSAGAASLTWQQWRVAEARKLSRVSSAVDLRWVRRKLKAAANKVFVRLRIDRSKLHLAFKCRRCTFEVVDHRFAMSAPWCVELDEPNHCSNHLSNNKCGVCTRLRTLEFPTRFFFISFFFSTTNHSSSPTRRLSQMVSVS